MLKDRNSALYEALQLFAKDVLKCMSDAMVAGARVRVYSEYKWQATDDRNTFVRGPEDTYDYWHFARRMDRSFKLLPTYHQVRELVLADEAWGIHADKLVGSAMGRHRIDAESFLLSIPIYSLSKTHQLDLSQHHFDLQVEMFENFFQSPTLEVTRLTPLYGVTLQSNICLSDSISVELISTDQKLELLEVGIISTQFQNSTFGDAVHNAPQAAIVSRCKLPKIIGETELTDTDFNFLRDLWSRLSVDEDMVVDLLTLVLEGAIRPLGTLTKPSNLIGAARQIQKKEVTSDWAMANKNLSEEAQQKLLGLWPILNESTQKSRHFLAIAVRRFSQAMTRPSLDDKLIDLMICAEALFLRTEHSELTHKLAYRAALLLGENPDHKMEVFKFLKEAYAMRSKVVHGAKSYTRDPKDIAQLSLTTSKLADLLRKAILKMLALALNPQTPKELIDWESLMFNNVTIN